MKKKIIIGVTLVAVILLLAVYLYLSGNDMSYNTALNANWGIGLPHGGKEIYVKQIPEESFTGDGERYRVLLYDEEPVFDKNIVWTDDVSDSGRFLEIAENMQTEYVPDLSSEKTRCFHMTGDRDARDKLWLMYDEDNMLLYLVEDFY